MLNHTALLNERIRNWKVGGYTVEVEGQNSFQLRGKSATLAGPTLSPDGTTRPSSSARRLDKRTPATSFR